MKCLFINMAKADYMENPMEDGLYFLSYHLGEADFEAFNRIVMDDVTAKAQRRQIVLGMVAIVMVALILITFLVTKRFPHFFLVLTAVLFLLGLLSVLYFPVFFPRQIQKSVAKIYASEESHLSGSSFKISVGEHGLGVQETLADGFLAGEFFLSWETFRRAYVYEKGVVLMESSTGGLFLPSRILDPEMDAELKAFIIRHCRKYQILILYERK